MEMNRTRIVFFVIVGLALLIVLAGIVVGLVSAVVKQQTQTPTVVAGPTPGQVQPTPVVQLDSPDPVFAPSYDASDGLPT